VSEDKGAEKNLWTFKGKSERGWIRLHNVQLHNLYRSTGIFCLRGLFNDAVSNAA